RPRSGRVRLRARHGNPVQRRHGSRRDRARLRPPRRPRQLDQGRHRAHARCGRGVRGGPVPPGAGRAHRAADGRARRRRPRVRGPGPRVRRAAAGGRRCDAVDLVRLRRSERGAGARAAVMEVVVTGAGAVVERGAETHLPGALGLDADGSVPLGHLPEVVRGRASRAERVTQLLLAAGGRALATAGFDAAAAAETRAGIVVGTAFGCFLTNAAYQRRVAAGGQAAASPRLFAATVSNAAAGELAIAYRLGGPAVTVTAGGASGLTALGEAMEAIRAGRADVVVAGGVDALGGALADWLDAAGLEFGRPPAEAGAAVVLERTGRRGP